MTGQLQQRMPIYPNLLYRRGKNCPKATVLRLKTSNATKHGGSYPAHKLRGPFLQLLGKGVLVSNVYCSNSNTHFGNRVGATFICNTRVVKHIPSFENRREGSTNLRNLAFRQLYMEGRRVRGTIELGTNRNVVVHDEESRMSKQSPANVQFAQSACPFPGYNNQICQ